MVAEVTERAGTTEVVYVVARTSDRAHAWARANKPRQLAKVSSVFSELGGRGLHIPDVSVYVLDELPDEIRDHWLQTGCRLVYVS